MDGPDRVRWPVEVVAWVGAAIVGFIVGAVPYCGAIVAQVPGNSALPVVRALVVPLKLVVPALCALPGLRYFRTIGLLSAHASGRRVGAVRAEAFAVGLALFGVAIALVLGGSLWLFYLAGVAAATVFNRTVGVQPASELSLRRDAVGWGLFAISFYALLWAGVLLVVHSQS